MGMHRIRLLKELDKEQKVPEEEYVEMVRQKMNKVVRLSEAECSALTLDDLETIDRSRNYVLPNAYKRKLAEYREVYKIPTPEDEARDAEERNRQYRLDAAKKAYDEQLSKSK